MKKLAIGVDIGGTNTLFGLVDHRGDMYGESNFSTCSYPDIDDFVKQLHIGIQALIKQIDGELEIVGIGIGAPNANHYKGTIENAANIAWRGVVPIVEKIKRLFPDIPTLITNDANAAAIGEMMFGGAKGMKDFIAVTLGTGLGSGFVANGRLIYGHDSFAGELGHVIVNRGGRLCGCGRNGCLETYVSATGIKRTLFMLLADHIGENEFRDISFNQLTAKMITEAASRGNPIAVQTYDYTGELLGQALADAVAITSPEAIFLLGGVAKAGKYIFEPTKKHMEMCMMPIFRDKVKLLPSAIDDKSAAVLGASALIWQQISSGSSS